MPLRSTISRGSSRPNTSSGLPQIRGPRKIKWQSRLDSHGLLGIIEDVPEEQEYKQPQPQRPKPPRTPADPTLVDDDELEQYSRLQQRNLGSTLFQPNFDPPEEPVSHKDKFLQWQYGSGPVHSLEGVTLPQAHKRANPAAKKPKSHSATYGRRSHQATLASKQPLRHEFSGLYPKTHGVDRFHSEHKHRAGELCYVCMQRNTTDVDPEIHETMRAREKQVDEFTQTMQKQQHHKALAVDARLKQQQKEELAKAATFNLQAAQSRPKTAKDTVIRADVFAYRPATSHSQIRAERQELASHLQQQAAAGATVKYQRQVQEMQDDWFEREALERARQEERAAQLAYKKQTQEVYRRDLDSQVTNKTMKLSSIKNRTAVFKPSQLDSIHDHPHGDHVGGVFGPELYERHDQQEQQRLEEQRKLFAAQIEAEAARKRRLMQEKLKAQQHDAKVVEKGLRHFKKDTTKQKLRQQETKQEMASEWLGAASKKQARDMEEVAFRKTGAQLTLLEQTDDYYRCNGCDRDLGNTGASNVFNAAYMGTTTALT